MMPEWLSYCVFFVCFVSIIPLLGFALVERSLAAAAVLVLSIATVIITLVATHNAHNRVEHLSPRYFAIQEVGTIESPIDISVVEKRTLNITEMFNVVLYNPELYYLEEQSYTTPCNGWCLVTVIKQPSYRVVPRSLIEVQ